MDKKLVVGIADMKIAREEGMLITYALGSCLGICLYDPLIRLAALVHVMLPLNMEASRRSPLKYADTGASGRHCARWKDRAPCAAGSWPRWPGEPDV